MILGGGSNCQGCGCSPGCPACTHFSADDFFDTSTVSITVNGNAIAPVPTSPASYTVTPPAIVRSVCFRPSDTIKRVRFGYEYIPGEFTEDDDTSGCWVRRVYATLYALLQFSGGECTYSFRKQVFRDTGECSDTGGSASQLAWQVNDTDCAGGVPEDCQIEMLDWLATLSVSASFTYADCECPP